MKMVRGISPVIATVIIVAVAIAISIAVAGWLFGLWGGFAGGTAQVQISNIRVNGTGFVEAYIINTGTGSDRILRAELVYGGSSYDLTPSQATGTGLSVSNNEVVIEANARGWVEFTATNVQLNSGDSVSIKFYLEKSGTVTIPATVS
ncbi:MAG: hypothetical protein F7C07_07190 [Desulfurococcales archaeon]|nr:hypothetical protein [Desulfurococcales archaeon]